MMPVRCYTCNACIAHHGNTFFEQKRKGVQVKDILTTLGYTRMCCRRMFLTHVDLERTQLAFPSTDVVMGDHKATLHRKVKLVRVVSCD
jgi:DNA-directed RNA polymerase subunit N (RpoN/RPB10)